jgi:hypothetical protein
VDEQLAELKERISQMSDSELLQLVEVEYNDYREEAIEFAKAELTKRYVPFGAPSPDQIEDDPDDDEDGSVVSAQEGAPCNACGGVTRYGLLFSEKELTILFSDNSEERFVKAFACRSCGNVELVVDFDTEVEG